MSSSGQNNSGLMSSAGLIRYFEEESSTITIDPRTFLALSFFLGAVVHSVTAVL